MVKKFMQKKDVNCDVVRVEKCGDLKDIHKS